jgi:hypothetical protein
MWFFSELICLLVLRPHVTAIQFMALELAFIECIKKKNLNFPFTILLHWIIIHPFSHPNWICYPLITCMQKTRVLLILLNKTRFDNWVELLLNSIEKIGISQLLCNSTLVSPHGNEFRFALSIFLTQFFFWEKLWCKASNLCTKNIAWCMCKSHLLFSSFTTSLFSSTHLHGYEKAN